MDQAEERAVVDVLRRGSVFRYYGPHRPQHVQRLEQRAREFYGRRYALGVNSGTGALMVTMSALGIGPGDEVIVPAFMWVSTLSAVVQANAIPVLCEIDDSFNMDPRDLERRITPRTRLIAVVHMAGAPCDMGRIMKIAAGSKLAVVEDCAQCNGGSFGGRRIGAFGQAGIFSFQINKNATAGEGGLILTDDENLYGRLAAAHDVGVPWKSGGPDSGAGIEMWGQGRRMSELCGAVANVQLRKLPRIVAHMRGSNARVRKMLAGTKGLEFRRLNDPKGDTGPFIILMLESAERAKRTAAGIRAAGYGSACRLAEYGLHVYSNIGALVHKAPLSSAGNPWSLPANRASRHNYARGACPRSDELFDRSVLVTIPSRLDRRQEKQLAAIIRDAATAK
jgi:8-amino-3,8-dideoxy-alpha-D-manno-octulosonate transaminase